MSFTIVEVETATFIAGNPHHILENRANTSTIGKRMRTAVLRAKQPF
jgi:hypothetical protein